MSKDLRPVYTAPTEAAAKQRFGEFAAKWGGQYPAIIRSWDNAWTEFVPLLDYDVEIRRVICSTNAIESLKARYRRAIRARGHFPEHRGRIHRQSDTPHPTQDLNVNPPSPDQYGLKTRRGGRALTGW